MTLAPQNSVSYFGSEFALTFVPAGIGKKRTASSSVSIKAAMAAVEQALTPCFRRYGCKSSKLVSANSLDFSALVLDGILQLVLTDPPYGAHHERDARHSACEKLKSCRSTTRERPLSSPRTCCALAVTKLCSALRFGLLYGNCYLLQSLAPRLRANTLLRRVQAVRLWRAQRF